MTRSDETFTADVRLAEPPLALGVDIGTSSVRAFLFDREGRNLGGTRVRYTWHTTPDGGAEVDADALVDWTAEAIDGALDHACESSAGIAAVGMAALWHSLVGVGADGEAITPLYAWSDMRASGAALVLRQRLAESAVHARTGAVLHPSYLPARLLWLSHSQPTTVARVRYWMSGAEYVTLRLFGERRVSLSMASGSGLLDQHTCRWDAEVLAAIPASAESLSTLVDLDAPFSGLRPEYARRWPALRDVPWLPPLGDGACSNVGSGCAGPDTVALSLGTSGAMRVLVRTGSFVIPPGLWCYRLDAERIVLGGAVSNAGNLYRWMREMLRLPTPAEIEAELAQDSPAAHGLVVLPFLAGDRSPDWPTAATATIAGVTLDTRSVDILRAGLEAVAYRLVLIHRLLSEHFPSSRIVASGGSVVHSPAWVRIIADALGVPVAISGVYETTSRGAALLALERAGMITDATALPAPVAETVLPDPERHRAHQEALERHRALDMLLSSQSPRQAPGVSSNTMTESTAVPA